MKAAVSNMLGTIQRHRSRVAAAIVIGGSSTLALAGGGSGPPTMPAIDLPIDLSSVASAIALVGGTMLLLWAGVYIGFKLARKFITRAGQTV